MLFTGSVGKIDSGHVRSRIYGLPYDLWTITGWSDSADDFGFERSSPSILSGHSLFVEYTTRT